ncbi:MAG: LTA synthase family protein [Gemmatimonadales bacterium]|nr:LTA synthase family protein [Gemmatimonadales bacterium]
MRARVRAYLKTFGFWLGYFWVARALFLVYHRAEATALPVSELGLTFVKGFRLDASGAAYLTAVPAALLVLSTLRPLLAVVPALHWIWTGVVVAGCSLLIAADLELFRHWDRRIDGMVLEYLKTPAEAWASTGGTPRITLILVAVALAAGALFVVRRWVAPEWRRLEPVHPLWSVPSILFIGLLVVPARGGTQVVSVTQSSAYFSRHQFANLAALNAAWGFFDSVSRGGTGRTNPYLVMPADSAQATIVQAMAPVDPLVPVKPVGRPNILVILWESASAGAFSSLGGEPGVTPRFDALAREGILFRRFYAGGDRTDKGLIAALSGFPAIPTGSIVKTPSKARSLPKLANDLALAGYRTSFHYGGELEFASIQAYLIDAGFDRIVGKGDFPRASWNSKWGAHDGVVAEGLLADLDGAKEPFFSVWLTLSSHEPFETPVPPRIVGTDWRSLYFNSMSYTDQVIGDLIERARTKPWWNNTLVVILADHGRRVAALDAEAPARGSDRLFHIPMLWLGGAVPARDSVVDRIGSQLDLAPTLLDLVGVPAGTPYPWGRSLLRPSVRPFAYYGFEVGYGLITDSGALVYDGRAGRITSRTGPVVPADDRLGQALLQATYQDYLDR